VLPRLKLGSYELASDTNMLGAVAMDLAGQGNPEGGIIGRNVLDTWGSVVDVRTTTLYLGPPLKAVWPRLVGTWKATSSTVSGAARKLDEKKPITWEFTEEKVKEEMRERVKITEDGKTTEYLILITPNTVGHSAVFVDVKDLDNKDGTFPKFAGIIKAEGNKMTACLVTDLAKSDQLPEEFAAPKDSPFTLIEFQHNDPEFGKKKLVDPLRELMVKDGYTAVPMERDETWQRFVTAKVGKETVRLMVDTGCTKSLLETKAAKKTGARELEATEVKTFTGKSSAKGFELRGITIGDYDTRKAWKNVEGGTMDLTAINAALTEKKMAPLQGMLGNVELLNGAAVIDFHNNVLYLKPLRDVLKPKLEGTWIGTNWELDGKKGTFPAGFETAEFKNGNMRLSREKTVQELAYHIQDEGAHFRLGAYDPKTDVLAADFKHINDFIIRVADDKLQFLMVVDPAKYKEGNITFAAPKNSGLYLIEYQRKGK
jgi:Aspartyl protease